MKVALVTSLDGGGPVEHALVLAQGLSDAGVAVRTVCATSTLAARFAATGAEVIILPLRSPWDVAHGLAVRRATLDVEIIHAQDRRAGLWTRLLPRSPGTALVYTVHGLPDPYLPPPAGPLKPGLRAALAYRGLDVALTRRADAVVTPSSAVAEALVSRLGYPKSALTVVRNGVQLRPPAPTGAAVGTLSVLEPVKGLDVFLQAAQQLALERPGLPIIIFGAGSQEAALRGLARDLGLADRVEFAGHTPALEALGRLAVLALPSLMENCPMAMLEAMAAGVPVVASRVGGIPEMAPTGAASLVPAGNPRALSDAIGALLDNAAGRRAQAARARAHVEQEASQAVMTERMVAVYHRARAARAGR